MPSASALQAMPFVGLLVIAVICSGMRTQPLSPSDPAALSVEQSAHVPHPALVPPPLPPSPSVEPAINGSNMNSPVSWFAMRAHTAWGYMPHPTHAIYTRPLLSCMPHLRELLAAAAWRRW